MGAAPLKCAICGTVVSWPNGKAAASQTCPVCWPISRPLDARTGRSAPLAHDEPKRSPEFAATYSSIAKRRGKKIATIAISRKLLTRAWHLLADMQPADASTPSRRP